MALAVASHRQSVSKVPQATALFWTIKILTTGMGETTSDFVVTHVVPELGVTVAGILLVVALTAQFRASRFRPGVYWTAVVMVSIFGTMVADVVHVVLNVPYAVSSAVFAAALAATFGMWRRREGTLSIHSIVTRRREAFYWAAILITFALGTAVGDLTATVLHLGYLGSGVLFAAAFAIPAVAHLRFGANPIASFWIAYVLTRPLGASFADWAGVGPERGGLGLGTGPVSVVLAVAILTAVVASSGALRRRRPGDTDHEAGTGASTGTAIGSMGRPRNHSSS